MAVKHPAIVLLAAAAGCGLNVPDGNTVVAVPFAVSDQFTASGFMGDAGTAGVVTAHVDDAACLPRPTGAIGSCYAFVYTAPAGGLGWAGVYWQAPVSNWGQFPGKPIAPGATRARFQAATASGSNVVDFRVGGLAGGIDPATGAAYPYTDTLAADATFTPTTSWAAYEVAFPAGASYGRVLGGFAWSTPLGAGSTATIYLDDIRWEP
jgi:hypothetical protein